ncbi:AMP-binding protein [Pseudomonas chlororaphis]|uniref:AMP-binding protein n=1 Tax=Pseudomonas chlororaphis TaxID=587753 RepID=UPI001E434D76|nr:AMP-binding protein [Pseudomonas chlororaphis]MCB2254078.1 AMP-binding protein [Pseudomonas chlororaphis]
MSVHELKRSPLASAPAPEQAALPADALARLQHWAQVSPLHNALRHKRHGQWYGWRWIDALRDVERLADGLRQQGCDGHSRLAVSGPFEPNLLLLALAAHSIGAQVLVLDDDLGAEALQQALWRLQPSHGFVHARQSLLRWVAAGENGVASPRLITDQPVPRLAQGARQPVLAFGELLGVSEAPRQQRYWRHPAHESQLWSEEGTEWAQGLEVILTQWLGSGHSLAFPESRGSASRDRREAVPSGLLLSAARLQRLADEIESRLAPPGSWRRRLCEWAIAQPQRPVQRLIKHRVRRLLGFQRLHYIWQAPSSPAKPAAPLWLAEFKRNIA